MFSKTSYSFAVVLALLGATAADGQDESTRRSLPAQRPWVRFGVVMGRIRALNSHYGQSLSTTSGDSSTAVREAYSINVSSSKPSVHYTLTAPDRQLTVDFGGDGRLVIERRPIGDSSTVALQLVQPAEGPLVLILGNGESARVCQGDTFWHLLFAHRAACDEHLLPILQSLRPDWRLSETADRIELALVRAAGSGMLPDRQRWRQMVEQLGSRRFAERSIAEREFRSAGQAVVPFLDHLNARELDAEQRERIRQIVSDLTTEADDGPDRAASWLVHDESIWLDFLTRDEVPMRQMAAEQLARLLGRQIDFHPEADAAVRQEQWTRLHARVARRTAGQSP